MQVLQRRIRYTSRKDVFALWFAGDLHVGSASCNEEAINRWVRDVAKDEFALVFLLGDLAEFIPRSDWRFRQSRLAQWLRGLDADYSDDIIQQQVSRVVEILRPVAPRVVGALTGNHEDKQLARWERDVHAAICRELKIENLGVEAIARLVFTRGRSSDSSQLDIYLHHGWFASRKSGAKVNTLMDLFAFWDVDIIAVGHGHERLIAPPVAMRYVNSAGELSNKRRLALMTGAFLESHREGVASYADEKGYRPNDVGAVRLLYTPSRRALVGEI